ncbi:uncharacterized protein LOC129869801 [Solanum dulcamara]|uniref:uncharacterized protein LOC129869801 n=1 Tax=Solanum dulcamara TaxID=45834 RepID=UPI0024851A51|nr:uncharacterized protein LOC129869801 [Solanum dulcamara]
MNGVGILVDVDLRECMVEVKRISNRKMFIKLVIGRLIVSDVSAYAPHVGLDEEVKRLFWEDLDEKVRGFGFRKMNGGEVSLLEFAKAFELVIANSCFLKKDNQLVTFSSMVSRTQIDYVLLQKGDNGLCKDCKVIPSENIVIQHKLLVMDLEIKRDRRKKTLYDRPRIR